MRENEGLTKSKTITGALPSTESPKPTICRPAESTRAPALERTERDERTQPGDTGE